MQIIKRRKIFYILSTILMVASLVSLILWGLNLGIDFTGGTLMEVEFLGERPANQTIREKIADLDLGQVSLQPTGEKGLILRFKDIDEATHQQIISRIGEISEKRFESIGPLIGKELKQKSFWAIIFALIGIIVYIAWAFRKVSKPVASWQYGLVAIIILFHDIFITCGLFSVLGHFKGMEVGLPFVAALLTILGYSVNDTIVIFDRARENLLRTNWDNFEETMNLSINQSIARCLNTSITTLLVLLAVFFLGGETIEYFALALIIGIAVGTYSSIFLTSSLIVSWQKRRSG